METENNNLDIEKREEILSSQFTKENKPKKILILGSGALKIGEAGEFDFSGSQCLKAFREEGIKTVLINPNIATYQTSEGMADKVYYLPITQKFVTRVIKKEKPDGVSLSFGGQTALNCGVKLDKKGIFEKYNVKVLGTSVKSIIETEDRELFVEKLNEINAKSAKSFAVKNTDDALDAAKQIGYPIMLRIAYALGGLGSGICRNPAELKEKSDQAFKVAPQILIEEYLKGWKEVEYEVVRDQYDNCITVCNMENFDPMGIHTGESIVVAPSQTLTNSEYHMLREISIRVIRHIGIIGECNIQFAFDPRSEDYRIIEVNARLSRSSALASKATGYPLAFVAAKLALGYGLTELENKITKVTKSCFEPALDYVVVKIPKWDLKKFSKVSKNIGTVMKSVGEVMAIGRKFEEAFQKAIRMVNSNALGISDDSIKFNDLRSEIENPTDERIFAIYQALKKGLDVDLIHKLSDIDSWFLYKIKNIVDIEKKLSGNDYENISKKLLLGAKKYGFSDRQIAKTMNCLERNVREKRIEENIHPVVKQIDTLGGEFPAVTNYLYLTYNGTENDIDFKANGKEKIVVLGSGSYRIGSSVEFDWCCVNTTNTLRDLNYETIMINYNPETVSTDYDMCDKLYFDELSFETVYEIYNKELANGVIVSMGGQIPNNLVMPLYKEGVNILGTRAESIDSAENRYKFSNLLDELNIDQPDWQESTSMEEAELFAENVGYPVLIRPSYVLSGAAMNVATNKIQLETYLSQAANVSKDHPVVISKFILDAKEIEMDAVAKNGEIVCYAISEHVENAGVHSGDATLVLPPQRTYLETLRKVKETSKRIAKSLEITGPFNIQYLAKKNKIKVIECNLRASRSFPFVSKIFKTNFIDIATKAIMNKDLPIIEKSSFDLDYVGVKAPQFSFQRLIDADPILGVEMASTGEVGCIGNDFNEAFLKSLLSVKYKIPKKNILLSTGPIENKAELLESCKFLNKKGYHLFATQGTAEFLIKNNLPVELLNWPLSDKKPNVIDYLKSGQIDFVINIPKNFEKEELTNDYQIRRTAVDYNIPLLTNIKLAKRFIEAISEKDFDDLLIKSWDEY